MSNFSGHRLLYPGLLLFGLSLPLSKSASTILLVALYVSALAGVLFSKEFRADVIRSCRQPLTAALALFSLVAYLGIFHSLNSADGFKVANKFVTLPIIYFFISVFLQSERSEDTATRKAEALLFSFLAGLTALNLFGVLTFLGAAGGTKYVLPLAPLGQHHIWFSNINALGLYTALSFLLFTRRGASPRTRALLICFLALAALCILLSTSRTAWFGIASTAAIMAAVLIKRKKTVFFAALFAVLLFALAYQFVPLVHDRMNLVAEDIALFSGDRNPESSLGKRLFMWRAALLMFEQGPLVGIGTGDYFAAIVGWHGGGLLPDALVEFNQPHNMYLFTMATNGLVGLTALLYIFYRSLRHAAPIMRSDGREKMFAFLAMATAVHFMVAGFMDSFFNIQVLRYSFAFIMGVCIRSSVSCARQLPHPDSP